MSLEPLLNAPLAVQLHVYTVVPAAVLGAYILSNRKGTAFHKLLGRIWIVLMVATSLSTFFIHSINLFYGFSPFHFLSARVIYTSVRAVFEIRRGHIEAHKRYLVGSYVGGIVIAGLFTMIPGRIMNEVVFGGFDFRAISDFRFILWAFALMAALYVFARTILPKRFRR